MDLIRWLNDSDFGQLFSFLGMIIGIFGSAKWSILFYKRNSHPIKSYGLLTIILLLGLILPLFNLFTLNWSGWKNIVLNGLAFYGIFSFIMLIYISRTMTSVGK